MRGRGLVWPLLAYGALAAIAVARRGGGGASREAGSVQREQRPASPRRLDDRQRRNGRVASEKAERRGQRKPGRRADAPWRIPWAGWKDILRRVYSGISENRLLAVAAGVVFYAILALFPALAAFVSLYGLFADTQTIDSTLSILSGVLPGGAMQILHEELQRLLNKGSSLGFGFAIGLILALWSANSGVMAVIDALNVAYDEKETRNYLRLYLLSFAFTLGAIAALMLGLGAVVVAPILLNYLGLGGVASTLVSVFRWPALVLIMIVGLAVLYRYAPNRREPRWVWLSVGSVFASLVWLIASVLFSWYIGNFGTYNVTYGSLGAAVGMMVWMWISMIVVLVGAQLNAEIERQTGRDMTSGATSK